MSERHARLAGAIALAREEPVRVERADAASYVEGLALAPGRLTVIWHSVMWQYVPREQQERVTARLAAWAEQATVEAPLVHLFAEPTRRTPGDQHRFWVVAEAWPSDRPGDRPGDGPGDGERRFLGQMAPHGIPVTWE